MNLHKKLNLTDKFIIGTLIFIVAYSIIMNAVAILANYFNTVSPLIPASFHWTLSEPNLYFVAYWFIVAFLSFHFYKNYSRTRFILLIVGALVSELIVMSLIDYIA